MDQPTYEVAELTGLLSRTFEEIFPDDIWVVGEISNLTRSKAGHVYFDLVQPGAAPGKAPDARISVVLFQGTRTIVNKLLRRAGGIRMDDGMAVRIRGVVDFYPPQGRLQLRMTSIDPTYTLGAVALEREALLERLRASGAVGRQALLAMPPAPQRVGLVTSEGSAAEHDFLQELHASGFAIHVHALHTRVQGNGADHGLAAAVAHLSTLDLDVIVIARGGGARGDLVAFDSETLAMAIAGCATPVITGIGHETDRSIADEVAHVASKTPTACARVIIDRLCEVEAALAARTRAVATAARHAMATAHAHLDGRTDRHRTGARASIRRADARVRSTGRHVQVSARRSIAVSEARLGDRAGRVGARTGAALRRSGTSLDGRRERLGRTGARFLALAARELDTIEARVRAVDPAVSFARGWSITRRADGTVIREVGSVGPGDDIITQVIDGEIHSRVDVDAVHGPDETTD